MKRVIAILAALLVASCTSVENFGAYWDKGVVDPALEGSWKKVGLPGKNIDSIPGADTLRFIRNGAAYSMQALNPIDTAASRDVRAQQQADNDRQTAMRTLRVGTALLMMVRSPTGEGPGIITRYAIHGTTLQEYWIENSRAVAFLAINYPDAKNIRRNTGEGSYVVIGTFDDEVFKVLSELAANPKYWRFNCEYRKSID
jgi:hypothetical protein